MFLVDATKTSKGAAHGAPMTDEESAAEAKAVSPASEPKPSDAKSTAPQGKRPAFGWFLGLGAFLVTLICGVAGIASVFLSALGVGTEATTFYYLVPTSPFFKYMVAGIACVVAGIVCALLYLVCCCQAAKHAERINEKRFVLALSALAAILCIWWVFTNGTEYNGFSDSHQLLAYAQQLAAGDYSSFLPHSESFSGKLAGDMYLSNYPFQSGILLLMEGFVRVFGDHAVLAFQLANSISAISAALGLVRMTQICERPKAERLVTALLAITFAPPLLFVVFPYGNAIGFALAMLAVELWMRSRTQGGAGKWRMLAGAFVLLTLGLMVKSTYLVVAIGALIVLLVDCARKRDGLGAAVLVISLLAANSISGAVPARIMEARLGYELPENQPKLAWIAMGLSNDNVFDGQMPGWWGASALQSQAANEGDVEGQEEDAKASIANSLQQFTSDPGYAVWFFGKKLASEWLDPTFQSLYIADIGTMTPEAAAGHTNSQDRSFDPWDSAFAHGKVVRVLYVLMEGQQSLIYLGSSAGAAVLLIEVRRRRERALDFLLPCAFFMGFFVYVLWEAKGMYCMPFFFCLIPTAARGITKARERVTATRSLPS